MSTEATAVWDSVVAALSQQVSDTVWNSTFRDIEPTDFDGNVLTLSVPSQVLRQRIEQRYQGLIEAVLSDEGHGSVAVVLDVDVEADTAPGITEPSSVDSNRSESAHSLPSSNGDTRPRASNESSSTPVRRYAFDTFVTGPSNRFAHAAALSVAETPARSYNPLFVYGDAGLGKTHLLQAISSYVKENYPDFRVRYISTETMLNEFVEAIRNNTQQTFKQRYRQIDVLLVDDIQFMEGKEQLQEEFFHTFNTLHDAQRQIVLSSDRPPDAIPTLEDRLRSRFKMGLITDIQPPDFETRLAILRKKAERLDSQVPPDVLEFIATHITYNIRELEGALIRVNAYATLNEASLSVELTREILSDVLQAHQQRPLTAALILEAACQQFSVTKEELCSTRRTRDLVHARQVSMYVCRELTDLSYPQIGAELGGKDHSTVIYAYEKISEQLKDRQTTYDDVTTLITTLRSGG